ncbi:MAG: PaaI family thioesterase [Dermatophilaceae bacterium]
MSEDTSPQLVEALTADPLAGLLGIRILDISPGHATASMLVTDRHLNAVGSAHGGATMALIDVVHAAVSNSHGTFAVAQDVHTEFAAPAAAGDELMCEGVELHRTRRTAVYRIEVRVSRPVGEPEPLVATALARVYRIGTPWLTGESDARSSPSRAQPPR